MKRLLLPLLILPLPLLATSYVTVWENGASPQSFELASRAVVSYETDYVSFRTDDAVLSFPYSSSLRFEIGDAPTSVANIEKPTIKFRITGKTLSVSTGKEGAQHLTICDATGKVVVDDSTDKQGEYSADLSGLGGGIYIFKSDFSSFKFILK